MATRFSKLTSGVADQGPQLSSEEKKLEELWAVIQLEQVFGLSVVELRKKLATATNRGRSRLLNKLALAVR